MERLELSILNKLLRNDLIDISEYEFYKYGLEVLVMNLVPVLLVVFVSILSRNVIYGFSFLCAFIPIRINAGGYHCSKIINCLFIFMLLFILSIFIQKYINQSLLQIIGIVSILLIYKFKPQSYDFIEDYNNRIHRVKKDIKIISIFLLIITLLVADTGFRNGVYSACIINVILHFIGVCRLEKGENNGNK